MLITSLDRHAEIRELPCPACGFRVFADMYGSYDVCPVCGWEDDCVQLANPTSEGGANKRSLWSCQQVALELVPRETEIHDGFSRDPRWRPLNVVEVNASNLKKSERHWHAHGIVALAEAYWMLSSP